MQPNRFLSCLVGLFAFALGSAGVVPAAELSFVPASPELACAEERAVDLWIDSAVADLRGFSVVVEFDPGVVEPTAVEAGQLLVDAACPWFENWNNATAVGDSVFFDAASLGCSVEGPGPIARLWLKGVADGVTALQVRSAILRDGANQPIVVGSVPGQVVVSCPVRAAVRSWSTLKRDYR